MKTAASVPGIFLCLWLLNTTANAAEISNIRFVSESWEGITNPDGTGLCWEIFRRIYEPVGITVEFDIMPYARATQRVQNKNADASVGVYQDEYEGALFAKWHYLQDIVFAIFKKGTVASWNGEQSLRGNVGWIRGYAFNEYLQIPLKFLEVDTRKSGLKMLEAGRLDFFLDTEGELLGALEEEGLDTSAYQIETILTLNVYLAFADNARGKALAQIFDDRMETLVKSGELKPIYEKWNLHYPFEQ